MKVINPSPLYQNIMTQKLEKDGIDLAHWALHTALASLDDQVIENKIADDRPEVDIVFQINGIDVDFKTVVNAWGEQINQQILRKAEELLTNQFGDVQSLLSEYRDTIEDRIQVEVDKLYND